MFVHRPQGASPKNVSLSFVKMLLRHDDTVLEPANDDDEAFVEIGLASEMLKGASNDFGGEVAVLHAC